MRYLIIFIFVFLFSADLDFDGVDDKKDYCPRTPLLAVVNKHGCELNKSIPFNQNIEIGEDYILPQKITQQYLKSTIYHKSYELSIYFSRVNLNSSYHSYTKLFDISKKFYTKYGYNKLSFIYYSKTYYNKQQDFASKFTIYVKNYNFLFYYKFKKTEEDYQKNINTFFLEKFIKYPKVILIPFFYIENTYTSSSYNKYIGIVSIIKLKNIYIKPSITKQLKQGNIFSIAFGKNF